MGLSSCLARWTVAFLLVGYAYGACIPSYNQQYNTQILHKAIESDKSCHCNIEQNNINICPHNTNTGCSNNQQICDDGSSADDAHLVPLCPNQQNNCYQPQCAQPICDGSAYSCGQCADDQDDHYYYYYYPDVDNQDHSCNCSQTNHTKTPSTTVNPTTTVKPTTKVAATVRPTTTKKPATTVKQITVSPTTKKPTTVRVVTVPTTQEPALAPRMSDTWTFPVHPKSEDITFFKF